MCIIRVNNKCRQYKKEDKAVQKSICMLLKRLSEKISQSGDNVNEIFNCENVIHDRINDQMYIYKAHGVNNIQLRIVYSYEKIGDESVIYLIDYVKKKKNNKEYLSELWKKFGTAKLSDMIFVEISFCE